MSYFYILYIVVGVASIIELSYKWYMVYTQKRQFTVYLNPAFLGCITSWICNMILMFNKNKALSLPVYELNYVCLDIIVYFIYLFSKSYTNAPQRKMWRRVSLVILIGIDVILLFVNTRTNIYFDIVRTTYKDSGHHYWSLTIYKPMIYHYVICAIIIAHGAYTLLRKLLTVPFIFKRKYSAFLWFYLFSTTISYLSNILDWPQDFSVYTYAGMSTIAFIHSLFRVDDTIKRYANKNIIRNFSLGVCWFNRENVLVYTNDKAGKLFAELHMSKQDIETFFFNFIKKNHARTLRVTIGDEIFEVNGKKYYYTITYRKIYENKHFIGSYLNFKDITEERERKMMESMKSMLDPLTGIYNSKEFFNACNQAINDHSDKKWLMLCSAIKDYKILTNIFGKEICNNILKAQAETIKKFCHKNSVYGRIVDEKFAILVQKDDFDEAFLLDKVIDVAKITNNQYYHLSLMIGVYEAGDVIEKAEYMYDKAFMAIDNKEAGSTSRIYYYNDGIMKQFLANRSIVTDFDYAFNSSQLLIYLQPIFNIDKKMTSAEAVVKWNKPGKGILDEKDFIPLLEKTEILYQLDVYKLEKVIQQLSRWNNMGYDNINICVNLSSDDLYYGELEKILSEFQEKYAFNPANLRLCFEEDVFSKYSSKMIVLMKELKKQGYEVQLNNFGKNYFDFTMLTKVDFDYIDLDSTLSITTKSVRENIVFENVFKLVKDLSIKVLANNITTEDMFETCKRYMCDSFQGDYLGETVSRLEFEKKYL